MIREKNNAEITAVQAQVVRRSSLMQDAARVLKETGQAKLAFFQKYGDPIYAGKEGMWLLLGKGDRNGKGCDATFISESGSSMLSLLGPTEKSPPALGTLHFFGSNIPVPQKSVEVRVTLTDNTGDSSAVRSILLPLKDKTAVLIVPTADMVATIRGTADITWIGAKLNGKEVFRTDIGRFLPTRDAMLKCMKASK